MNGVVEIFVGLLLAVAVLALLARKLHIPWNEPPYIGCYEVHGQEWAVGDDWSDRL